MTKKEIEMYKRTAKECMETELGFSPAINKIELLETGFNGFRPDYIRFRVSGNLNIEYVITTTKGMTSSGYELTVENDMYDMIQLNR